MLLLVINLFLLLIGLFMETNAAITIFTPMVLPPAMALGVDPMHFGIIMVLKPDDRAADAAGGPGALCVAKVAEVPMNKVVVALFPFYIPLFLALLLVTYVPQISLFLPGLMK